MDHVQHPVVPGVVVPVCVNGPPVRADRQAPGHRAAGDHHRPRPRDHVDVRIRKRAPRAEAYGAEPFPKRSYNGPVYQSQEQVQQSVYEFSTGGFGNIKSYR